MVKIRLTRLGKKGQPVYRIVAIDSRKKRDGAYIENLGSYNPSVTPEEIKIDRKGIEEWVKKGAQISDKVRELMEAK